MENTTSYQVRNKIQEYLNTAITVSARFHLEYGDEFHADLWELKAHIKRLYGDSFKNLCDFLEARNALDNFSEFLDAIYEYRRTLPTLRFIDRINSIEE